MSANRDAALRSVRWAEAEAIRAGADQTRRQKAAARNVRWTGARIALFLRLWPTVMQTTRILEEMNKLDPSYLPISGSSMTARASYYGVKRERLPVPEEFAAGEMHVAPRPAGVETAPMNTEDRHTARDLLRRGKAASAEELVAIFGCKLAEAREIVDGWRATQARRIAA